MCAAAVMARGVPCRALMRRKKAPKALLLWCSDRAASRNARAACRCAGRSEGGAGGCVHAVAVRGFRLPLDLGGAIRPTLSVKTKGAPGLSINGEKLPSGK